MTEEQTENNNQSRIVAQTNNLAVPISIILAGILVAVAIVFSGSGGKIADNDGNNQPTGSTNEGRLELVQMQEDDHVLGNRDAKIYVLEFSDTECPFCKKFHDTMNQIVEEYNGEVAWVYRHFPLDTLHSKARKESEALECANELGGNDGFWAYTNRLYEITPSNDGLALSALPEIAEYVGLNRTSFEACLNSGKYAEEVQKDFDNAVALGGRGTPHSLIIYGDEIVPINGAQPFTTVKGSIDALLNK